MTGDIAKICPIDFVVLLEKNDDSLHFGFTLVPDTYLSIIHRPGKHSIKIPQTDDIITRQGGMKVGKRGGANS